MNQPHPGTPPFGQGGYPPPPVQGPPPKRPSTGRTLAWLAAGLVLVVIVIGAVALVVRAGDSGNANGAAADGPRQASCETYRDVVLSSEMWAATEVDPDRLQEMYDAVRADIADEEVGALVAKEATAVVSYYRALGEWKQSMTDALKRGETPDTTLPAELTAQQGEIPQAQGAVAEACREVLPEQENEPHPEVTAPTLELPSWMDEN